MSRETDTQKAQRAARNLLYRLTNSTTGETTDNVMRAAGWFFSFSDNSVEFKYALLDSLGLELTEDKMGALIVSRKV